MTGRRDVKKSRPASSGVLRPTISSVEAAALIPTYRRHGRRLPRAPCRQVAVIVAGGTSGPAIAATKTIPIVFTSGSDPVAAGLVSSLNKPEGNVTGATFYSGRWAASR